MTSAKPRPSLIVQRDRSVLLDLHTEQAEDARVGLGRFAELVKSPEHLHTYKLTSLSLWNASFGGMDTDDIVSWLEEHSATGVPKEVRAYIAEMLSRTGRLSLVRVGGRIELRVDPELREELLGIETVASLLEEQADGRLVLKEGCRGLIKKALVRVGYPVDDVAGYEEGDTLTFRIHDEDATGTAFKVRDYQDSAARQFYAGGTERGGAGVIVLPCGAGKTLVAIRAMELYQTQTLVLTTNRTAVAQWKRELISRTSLTEDEVGEYTGDLKEIKPVTVSTYQILTWRRSHEDDFVHFEIFSRANWGLVVYDEVHLLPAPVFRVTAELQARRRLGLTATLVREDGKEDEVFSLIGPCRYELPWRDLERRGYIAEARCVEVRLPLDPTLEERYQETDNRRRIRIAAENPVKLEALQKLIARHAGDRILVIGQYMRQLHRIARLLGSPIITGKTPNPDREVLYREFREGRVPVLIVSKVANFAIDLPDANVAIQVSGTFGSRQEEAQRLGRVLRPKTDGSRALFYTLVTEGTRDQEFSAHRQLFLAEQGYSYEIRNGATMLAVAGRA
ncbi:MAG: helicase [Planctomycetes bacterium]|nr:helicase [Planctomycetota bacterium]